MTYQIKIHNFEGPFDLLFHLIEKAEVDIYDIPIADITNQYLEYIYEMKNLDLESASEFIVMAATLIQIKSKMLLPKESNPFDEITADELDPRAELVEKLLEYKKYKEVSEAFKDMELRNLDIIYKPAEIIDDVDEDKILLNTTLADIINAFQEMVIRYRESTDESSLEQQILEEEFTVDDKIEEIRIVLIQTKKMLFRDLFLNAKSKLEIVITFLALLELIRLREIQAYQNTVYGDITIMYV